MFTPWTVQVLPRIAAVDDAYGNATDSWGPARTEPVYGWAPAGTTEVNGSRHAVSADLQVFAPSGFSCSPRDRMVVDGRTYDVQGEVEDFDHGPFGYQPGGQVNLRRVEGSS